jgi:hypothetical protein
MGKVLQLDVSPVKKKKKKKTLEVAEVKLKKAKKSSSPSEVSSIVATNSAQIIQLLEGKENDKAIPLVYRSLLQSLVQMFPMAEAYVHKTEGTKGIYQVNTLVSSIRELLVDIQAAQDRGMLGHQLVETVVKPATSDLAQEMVKEYSIISADAKELMTAEDYAKFKVLLTDSRTRLANAVNRQYTETRTQLIEFLES